MFAFHRQQAGGAAGQIQPGSGREKKAGDGAQSLAGESE